MKKETKGINPITINDNVWFYPVGKQFQFVVYIGHKVTQFNLSHRKIRKFLSQKENK